MKKIYFTVLLSCLGFAGFATTWYTQVAGDASVLTNWSDAIGGGGATPADFATAGDIWVIQHTMSCSVATFTIAGSLQINNAAFFGPAGTLNIGENLSLIGSGILNASGYMTVNLLGNLNVLDSSSFVNSPAWTTLVFNNTSSTLGSPQTITWTSSKSGRWTQMAISADCFVQLLSNVTLPNDRNQSDVIDGTLICGNYTLNCDTTGVGFFPFILNGSGAIYTANPGGIDASVICPDGFLQLGGYSMAADADYTFNGMTAQVTGLLLPSVIAAGGSVTVTNPAGVTLSQTTGFNDGSTLALAGCRLAIGSYNVNLGVTASITGAFSGANMIIATGSGMVKKNIEDEGSFLFPIGDNSGNYSPITVDVTGGSYSGAYVAVNVTAAKHPNNTNLMDYLTRFWTVITSGGLDYSITATYIPDDVVGTESHLSAGQYTGSLPWTKFGVVDTTAHTLSTTVVDNTPSDFTGISTAAPAITVTPGAAYCYGGVTTLNVLSATTDTPFTYSWAPATGLDVTTGTTVVANPIGTTTYTITVTDANGFTGTATTTVSVNPLPVLYGMTGGGNYCDHTGGVHIGLSGSDTGIRYQLYLNDTDLVGSPANGVNGALDFGLDTLEGVYTAIATDTLTGCTSNMIGSATVGIIPVVVPSVSISPSITDTICEGTLITFTADPVNGGSGPMYQWKVNDTVVGGSGDTYSYIPVNGDVVKIRLTSNAVCAIPDTAVASRTMTVSAHMTPGINLTVSPNDTVCQGTTVTVTAHPTFGGTAPSYLWIKNTLPVGTGVTYTYIPSNGDDIYCIMQSNYFCRTTTNAYSNVIAMKVQNPATSIPAVDIVAYPGTTIGHNKPDSLVALVSNGGVNPTYQWYRNGAPVPGATTNTYARTSFTNNDSISVIVTRQDACGMSTFNSVIITVTAVGVAQVTSGISELKLMPNPNKGAFTIKGTLGSAIDEEITVEVTDILGHVVYKNTSIAQQGNINEPVQLNSAIANGTYLLNLRSASGNSTLRFVVGQ